MHRLCHFYLTVEETTVHEWNSFDTGTQMRDGQMSEELLAFASTSTQLSSLSLWPAYRVQVVCSRHEHNQNQHQSKACL